MENKTHSGRVPESPTQGYPFKGVVLADDGPFHVIVACSNCERPKRVLRARLKWKLYIHCDKACQYEANGRRSKRGGWWYENGYRVLYAGNGKGKKEHIKIAEEMIGRPLRRDEVVHHRNGIRDDNRRGNLEVLTRADHTMIHRWEGTGVVFNLTPMPIEIRRLAEELDAA